MTSIADRRTGSLTLRRGLVFAGLLGVAATAVLLAVMGFTRAGASVPFAVASMLVGVVALNLMFALLDRWLWR